jgi:hypothetical protein
MYVMVCTRSNTAHGVRVVSRYMNNLGKENWKTIKWIFKYLGDTSTQALCFGGSNTVLHGYFD